MKNIKGMIIAVLICLTSPLYGMSKQWYPLEVDVWDPPFNENRQRYKATYMPLNKAQKNWKIKVLIPHLKDAYWKSVNYGLIDEARRLGVQLTIQSAGGYGQLETQKKQIESTLSTRETEKTDGIIISAVSAKGLGAEIEKIVRKGLPVIDLINGISSPHLKARIAVSFWDMGYQTGRYLVDTFQHKGKELFIAWFPGPEGAGWVEAGDIGFRAALKGNRARIVVSKYGDTGSSVQGRLVQAALQTDNDRIDVIAGTAVTAEVSSRILRKMGLRKTVKNISFYYSPGVHRGVKRGTVMAAPTDQPVIQARIAVDSMVRILEKKKYYKHVAPKVTIIDKKNIRSWDSTSTLAPRGFRPTFSINE